MVLVDGAACSILVNAPHNKRSGRAISMSLMQDLSLAAVRARAADAWRSIASLMLR